jgi:osmoprotectant transport system substrate-binding protein
MKTRTLLALAAAALTLAACTSGTDADSTASSGGPAALASTAPSTEASSAEAPASEEASAEPVALDGPITIGAFNFTESQILAELYAGVLRKAGVEVSITQSTNREVLQPALAAGEVQVVPEYLGTLTEFLNVKVNGPDAPSVANNNVERTLTAARELAEPLGITLLEPSPAEDVNAFAVTAEFAAANSIASLSDLAAWSQGNDLRLGGPPECPQRPFCQLGLESAYGMQIAEFSPLDAGGPLTKTALSQGSIDLGLVFSSDGSVEDLDLVVLEDDLGLQNVDNIVPALTTAVAVPQVVAALDGLSAALTTEDLVAMNKAVDIDRRQAVEVATEFLSAKGLG